MQLGRIPVLSHMSHHSHFLKNQSISMHIHMHNSWQKKKKTDTTGARGPFRMSFLLSADGTSKHSNAWYSTALIHSLLPPQSSFGPDTAALEVPSRFMCYYCHAHPIPSHVLLTGQQKPITALHVSMI